MKRTIVLILSIVMLFSLITGCGEKTTTTTATPKDTGGAAVAPKKVALLLSGPANDQGWNATAVDGLNAIKEKHDLDTTFMENVQIADVESAYTDYATQGYDLIIGHGYQFGEPAAKVSKNFPDAYFMATESSSKSPNTSSYVMACEQGAYMMGTLAALMTKTNVIGVVGGIEQPSITKELEAFKAAAKAINPDITVLSAYCNSFTDVTAGQAAASAMINQNADVLYQVANQAGTGVIKAAEENGLYALGNSYDQSSIAPETLLCSTVYNLPNVVLYAYDEILKGTFGDAVVNLGVKEDVVDIAWNDALKSVIGEDNVKKIDQMKADIRDGKIDVPLIETPTN